MNLSVDVVRLIQKKLAFPDDKIDGKMGSDTERAMDKFLSDRRDKIVERHFPSILSGGRKRKATALGQLVCQEFEIDAGPVDGLLGTQSHHAFEVLLWRVNNGRMPHPWRDHTDIPNPNNWPGDSQAALDAFYGAPGPNGRNVPLTSISLPYTHLLAWDLSTKVNSFKCHEKVADSLQRVLHKVFDHYGSRGVKELGLDLWGGCFNFRRKRGGRSLSTHSWGIAVDYHPEMNRLRWGWNEAVFALPDYDVWWEAWEEEGWVGLGRVHNFDWMHIQACRTPRLMLADPA